MTVRIYRPEVDAECEFFYTRLDEHLSKTSAEAQENLSALLAKWHTHACSSVPLDAAGAERAIREIYMMGGQAPPQNIISFASPFGALQYIFERSNGDLDGAAKTCEAKSQAFLTLYNKKEEAFWIKMESQIGRLPRYGLAKGRILSHADGLMSGWMKSAALEKLAHLTGRDAWRRRRYHEFDTRTKELVDQIVREIDGGAIYAGIMSSVLDAVRPLRHARGKTGFPPQGHGGTIPEAITAYHRPPVLLEAFELIFGLHIGEELDIRKGLHEACGGVFIYGDTAAVYGRPSTVKTRYGRLHSLQGAALEYDDGFSAYFIDGCHVPKWLVEHPARLSLNDINTESCISTKRILIGQFGLQRYLHEVGAKLRDEDKDKHGNIRRLWQTKIWRRIFYVLEYTPVIAPQGDLQWESIPVFTERGYVFPHTCKSAAKWLASGVAWDYWKSREKLPFGWDK